MYLNSAGVSSNFDEIILAVKECMSSIIILTETHLIDEQSTMMYSIEGYVMFNCLFHSRHTGGVTIYVKRSLGTKVVINVKDKANWLLAIKVEICKKQFIVGGLYHSPNSSDADFLKKIEDEWLIETLDDSIDNILCGAFNIDYNSSIDSRELRRVMEAYGLRQIVIEDTRVTQQSSTRIDLVFVNNTNCEASIDPYLKVTDHETICVTVDNTLGIDDDELSNVKCWRRYSRVDFCSLLRQNRYDTETASCCLLRQDSQSGGNILAIDLNAPVCDSHESFDFCVKSYDSMLKKNVAKLLDDKILYTNRCHGWYTSELARMKRQRDLLCRGHKQNKTTENWNKYISARNKYSRAIRNAKNKSIQDELERNKHDGKKMWKTIKRLTNPKNDKVNKIVFDGTEETDEQQIANRFNDYFIDSVCEIRDSIHPSISSQPISPHIACNQVMGYFEPISIQQLADIVKDLKTTSGIDNVSTKVFKDSYLETSDILLRILNTSLATGIVPSSWKESTIIPIQKVSNTKNATQYRPINMLELQEKVLEIVVKGQIMNFIDSQNILIPEQSGFRKNHSSETAINLILQNWKSNIENGKYTVAVFLDFKRAFETIDRSQLLDLLYRIGLRGTVLNWLNSYLSNRCQRTKYGNSISNSRINDMGVPQGSVLGPLLFILYINDLKGCIINGKLKLFADDATLYWTSDCLDSAIHEAENDLNRISDYLKIKRLCLNVSKTKWMIIGNKKYSANVELKIDGDVIDRVSVFKYLGVQVDEKLNFSEHVDYVIKKIAVKYGVLCRISRYLTFWSKVTYVRAVIMPHFDYCATVLLLASDTQIQRLQKLQNKVMRVILRCERLTSTNLMLDMLQWMSVKQRIIYNSILFIQKLKLGILPAYLTQGLQFGRDIHRHNTRGASDFRLPRFLKQTTQRSLFYKGLQIYNSLPLEVKCSRNMSQFKRQTIEFVKSRF